MILKSTKLISKIVLIVIFISCYAHARTIWVFLGPPGCGKGTMAKMAMSEFNFIHLSIGDLCRENISKGTKLGKELKRYVDKGSLAPDQIISSMTKNWFLEQPQEGKSIILDGYPRTVKQTKSLVTMLKEEQFKGFDLRVIRFTIKEKDVIERIANRVVCENKKCQSVYSLKSKKPKRKGHCDLCGGKLIKRSDDNEEIIKNRYRAYASSEKDIINNLRSNNIKIYTISSNRPIKEVFDAFKKIVLLQEGAGA